MVHMAENPTVLKASPKENLTDVDICPCLLSTVQGNFEFIHDVGTVQAVTHVSHNLSSDVQHLQIEKLTPQSAASFLT